MGKITVVSGALVVDEKILALERNVDISYGGNLDFPGGKVETGEKRDDALKREFYEETGLEVKLGHCIGYTEYGDYYRKYKNFCYFVYLKNNNKVNVQDIEITLSYEHQKYEWIDIYNLDILKTQEKLNENFKSIFPVIHKHYKDLF